MSCAHRTMVRLPIGQSRPLLRKLGTVKWGKEVLEVGSVICSQLKKFFAQSTFREFS